MTVLSIVRVFLSAYVQQDFPHYRRSAPDPVRDLVPGYGLGVRAGAPGPRPRSFQRRRRAVRRAGAYEFGNGWLRREDRRSVARGRDTAGRDRHRVCRQCLHRCDRSRTGRARDDRRRVAERRRYGGRPGMRARRRRCALHSGGTGCRAKRTACRRRSGARQPRAAGWKTPRARRDRSSGLARHRRSDRPPPAARGVFLDWRRNCIDQPAAPPRRSL